MARDPTPKGPPPKTRSITLSFERDPSSTSMSSASRLSRILSMTDQIAGQLHGLHFSAFHPPDACWQPAVNVYSYEDRVEVCMDLAGVEKKDIRVDVEPRRLAVSGHRVLPQNNCVGEGCGRILVMEIQDGRFERTLDFSFEIAMDRVEARQENGWLWIMLPKAARGVVS